MITIRQKIKHQFFYASFIFGTDIFHFFFCTLLKGRGNVLLLSHTHTKAAVFFLLKPNMKFCLFLSYCLQRIHRPIFTVLWSAQSWLTEQSLCLMLIISKQCPEYLMFAGTRLLYYKLIWICSTYSITTGQEIIFDFFFSENNSCCYQDTLTVKKNKTILAERIN